jgi:hypothetical protein
MTRLAILAAFLLLALAPLGMAVQHPQQQITAQQKDSKRPLTTAYAQGQCYCRSFRSA